MQFSNKLVKIIITILLVSVSFLAEGQEKYKMHQNKGIHSIESAINKAASKLGISDVKVTLLYKKDEPLQATVSYKGHDEKIIFTKEEVEKAGRNDFSNETKVKIDKVLLKLPPKVGPPY